MFRVTLYQDDIVWLAYAAGIAVGAGNANAAASLQGILGRLEPSDTVEPDVQRQPKLAVVEPEPEPRTLTPEEEAKFIPPPPLPPRNHQSNFGAGPPGPNVR